MYITQPSSQSTIYVKNYTIIKCRIIFSVGIHFLNFHETKAFFFFQWNFAAREVVKCSGRGIISRSSEDEESDERQKLEQRTKNWTKKEQKRKNKKERRNFLPSFFGPSLFVRRPSSNSFVVCFVWSFVFCPILSSDLSPFVLRLVTWVTGQERVLLVPCQQKWLYL